MASFLWVQSIVRRWMCFTLRGQPQWTLVPIDTACLPRVMFPFLCPSLRMVLAIHSPPGISPAPEVPFRSFSSTRRQAEAFCWHSQGLLPGTLSGAYIYWQRRVRTMICHLLSWETPAWTETSEEMSASPQGDWLTKSAPAAGEEMRGNWGQNCESTTSVCFVIHHPVSRQISLLRWEFSIVPAARELQLKQQTKTKSKARMFQRTQRGGIQRKGRLYRKQIILIKNVDLELKQNKQNFLFLKSPLGHASWKLLINCVYFFNWVSDMAGLM